MRHQTGPDPDAPEPAVSESAVSEPAAAAPAAQDDLLRLDLQLCFTLHAASRAFGGVYRRVLSDTGLTYPQYLAMLVLWEHGDMPVKRLGERLRLDSGTLSPLLKRMQTAGLVERERSADDERSVTVRVTAEGRALKERARCVPPMVIEASGLGHAEARELQSLLRQLTASLDASLESPAGEE